MSWFNNNIKKKTVPSSQGKELIQPLSPEPAVLCTKPVSISSKQLAIATLKKFAPLRDLDEQRVKSLPYTTQVFAKESILFIKGQKSEQIYYLLKGTVELQPDSDSHYQLSADETRAHLPLNSGKSCGATATAKTKVTLLVISGELNQLWAQKSNDEVSCVELIDIHLPEEINDQRFFNSFIQAYKENKLSLPSLPHVAFKLKEAIANDIGVSEAVEIIAIDPPIVSKLIQIANSPVYAPVNPITNCHEAVTRLGLEATRNLVMSIGLKQLFKSKDKQLMKGMQNLWQKSLHLSCLSFVLASETQTINPEDALLAGLVCDIGTIPLIHFAEQNPHDHPQFADLEIAIPYFKAPIGSLVLHTLGFSEEITAIPHHAEDWFYDSGDTLTLTDIIILAKLHSYISTKNTSDLPYINSIPAYSKLNDGKLDPDFSLQILHKAQKRINKAMALFA